MVSPLSKVLPQRLLPPPPSPTSVFRHQCSDCSALHQTVHRIKDFSERKSNKRTSRIGKAPSQQSWLYHELSNLPPFHLFWKEIHTLERFWVTASVYYEMYINFSPIWTTSDDRLGRNQTWSVWHKITDYWNTPDDRLEVFDTRLQLGEWQPALKWECWEEVQNIWNTLGTSQMRMFEVVIVEKK